MTLTRRARRRAPEAVPPPEPGPHSMPWWASPAGICLGFLLPVLLMIAYVGTINHPAITIRGVRFLTWPYLLRAASMLLVMAGSGWMGSLVVSRKSQPVHGDDLMHAADVVGLIALAIYCLWLRGLLFNPVTVFQVVTGQSRALSYVMAALLGVAIVHYLSRQRVCRQRLAARAQHFRGLPLAPRFGVPGGWR